MYLSIINNNQWKILESNYKQAKSGGKWPLRKIVESAVWAHTPRAHSAVCTAHSSQNFLVWKTDFQEVKVIANHGQKPQRREGVVQTEHCVHLLTNWDLSLCTGNVWRRFTQSGRNEHGKGWEGTGHFPDCPSRGHWRLELWLQRGESAWETPRALHSWSPKGKSWKVKTMPRHYGFTLR